MMHVEPSKRWLALFLLCLGDLMIVLDVTVVNVALPSIRTDLGFSETSLVWVINAYMLVFSGFLLLGGRLGDLYGHRKVFLSGLALFTGASLVCGLADSQWMLIAARAVQGLGGAVVSAVALSLIINLFTKDDERAKAMGYFGFVSAGGGAIGVVLGGLITGAFDWHWIFLINVPIGIAVFIACMKLLPASRDENATPHLDAKGAILVTASLMLAVYAIVGANAVGWLSAQTLGFLGVAVVLFGLFLYAETRVQSPLVPLGIFRKRNVGVASVIGILWSAAMFSWFFLAALYLQLVLGYSPWEVGLAFLPANLIMAAFSLGLSARIVIRYGTRWPLAIGMAIVAIGLGLFAFSPVDGNFWLHVLPGMLLLGIGAGMAFNPVLLAAMAHVPESESGLASGVLNTAFMMGGSLGLAVLASLAASQTAGALAGGADIPSATLAGYHAAFFVGALAAIGAAALAFKLHEPSPEKAATALH